MFSKPGKIIPLLPLSIPETYRGSVLGAGDEPQGNLPCFLPFASIEPREPSPI